MKLNKTLKAQKLLEKGISAHKNGNFKSALEKYKKALSFSPKNSDALHLAGLAFFESGEKQVALDYIRKAINENNNISRYYDSLGMILTNHTNNISTPKDISRAVKNDINKNRIENLLEAEKTYKKSIALFPNNYQTYFKLAIAQRLLDNPLEAIKNLRRSININSDHLESYAELGLAYNDLHEFEKAHITFDKAILIDENNKKIKLDKATTYLFQGIFSKGWEGYEIRGEILNRKADSNRLIRKIPDYNIKTDINDPLLILPEQGIGDEIMFSSLLPELIDTHKGRITLVCSARLQPIFQRSFPEIETCDLQKVPIYENQRKIYICSLGRLLRRNQTDFKPAKAYLIANKHCKENFYSKYNGDSRRIKVGISWKSVNPEVGHRRSLKLNSISQILSQGFRMKILIETRR